MTTIKTAKREYRIWPDYFTPGVFNAEYRPINQKTGQPWQASRGVDGKDCYVVANSATKSQEVRTGSIPDHPTWTEGGKWTGARTHFSTLTVAVNAVHADAARRKEKILVEFYTTDGGAK